MTSRLRLERPPFATVPEWVLYHPGLSDRAVRVYAILDRHADDQGEAWPGRSRLAELARTSVDSVDRALRELRSADVIEVEKRTSGTGDPDTNLYRLRFLTPEQVAADVRPPSRNGAARGSRTDAARGSRTGAAQTRVSRNESQLNVREGETDVSPSPAPSRRRERDPLWDALAEACLGTVRLSRALGREVGVAAADLRAQGVEAADLPGLVAAYRKRFPGCEASASAIAKWAPVLRVTATATMATRRERALMFVRNVGHELTGGALREELERFQLPHAEVDELVRIAEGTVVRSAAA